MDNNNNYNASNIKVLEGLEPVRLRPGMYIGSTSERGLHHLVYEVVDNSIDEALAGRCDEINVIINEDNSIVVIDDGSGIPVEEHPQTHKSTLETVLTVLHAGGKFDSNAYKISGGLHGVGVSVVNALSEWLIAEVKREGKIYRMKFERGQVVTDLEVIGKSDTTGTKISFKPDSEIFETTVFSRKTLEDRFREMAFLNSGVKITLEDKRDGKKEIFHYEGGIREFVEYLNQNKTPLFKEVPHFIGRQEKVGIEVALQYTDSYSENVMTFANNIYNAEGGTHLSGFRSALTRTINDYARKYDFIKEKEENLSGDDVREGITAIISVQVENPQFEGQTKGKLGNSEVRGAVDQFLSEHLGIFLEENPDTSKKMQIKTEMNWYYLH